LRLGITYLLPYPGNVTISFLSSPNEVIRV